MWIALVAAVAGVFAGLLWYAKRRVKKRPDEIYPFF